jgi:hypothetical protein
VVKAAEGRRVRFVHFPIADLGAAENLAALALLVRAVSGGRGGSVLVGCVPAGGRALGLGIALLASASV